MDTNLVAQLIGILAEKKEAVGPSDLIVVTQMIIYAVTPVLAAIAVFYSRASLVKTEFAHIAAQASAVKVEQIEKSVNHEREAMIAKLEAMHRTVLELSKQNAANERHA